MGRACYLLVVCTHASLTPHCSDKNRTRRIDDLFQSFDAEKYKFIRTCTTNNNNEAKRRRGRPSKDPSSSTLSLAALRIDERGGIYLNPLLDCNNAYFKCYVAAVNGGSLAGYALFFNTLDASSSGAAADDPVAVMEDLYVKPALRRRGIATQLFRRVLKVSRARNGTVAGIGDVGSGYICGTAGQYLLFWLAVLPP